MFGVAGVMEGEPSVAVWEGGVGVGTGEGGRGGGKRKEGGREGRERIPLKVTTKQRKSHTQKDIQIRTQ